MKKEKIILYLGTILALAAALVLFFKWNPEDLLKKTQTPITLKDIEKNKAVSYTGSLAGDDIPRLSGAEDFENLLYDVDFATAEPVELIPTGVYSLKPWVSPYAAHKRNRGRRSGKRKAEVIQSGFDLHEDYNPYYIIKLPDGSYILAQIPSGKAAAIKKGKSITLPIGQKTGMTDTARSYLKEICETYHVSMDGVFYAFDNQWYEDHYFTLFIVRFVFAAVVFFVLAVGFVMAGNRIFRIESGD